MLNFKESCTFRLAIHNYFIKFASSFFQLLLKFSYQFIFLCLINFLSFMSISQVFLCNCCLCERLIFLREIFINSENLFFPPEYLILQHIKFSSCLISHSSLHANGMFSLSASHFNLPLSLSDLLILLLHLLLYISYMLLLLLHLFL